MLALALLFWLSVVAVFYAYIGYPLALWAVGRLRGDAPAPRLEGADLPGVTIIVPVHNEQSTIEAKLANMRALDYPRDRLEIVFISDGSTDRTVETIRAQADTHMRVIELPDRGGKAAALNAGLAAAQAPIVVFTDAGIVLRPDALRELVAPFADPAIGCVSGEDRIAEAEGEGLYGRYELWLRRQESRLHSIVGASGSLYAQRRAITDPFVPQLAPDFLSVLRTVERGYRAVVAPEAVGTMHAVGRPGAEFERKVRTLLRGLTTLGRFVHLLNPFRYGLFALFLASHKLARWLVPLFMVIALVTSGLLASVSWFFVLAFVAQIAFYLLALGAAAGLAPFVSAKAPRIALYFSAVNAATLVAWIKYLGGVRQELWTPSRR
jgi:cellulose synthase/poly-beta-1,6-N-acetylglucosamine synthase-like glycosyltransferase